MYVIKQVPEDFVVEEVSEVEFVPGNFFCYWLKKRDFNTLSALQLAARANSLPLSLFSWAGNKDKKAVTKQLISVKGHSLHKVEFEGVEFVFAGTLDRPVSLGLLDGNGFRIVVRNLEELPVIKENFVNFFGEQRFSDNNARIGRALVKKNFREAVRLLNLPCKDNNFVSALRSLPKKVLLFYVHAFQSLIWNNAVRLFLVEHPDVSFDVELPVVGFGSVVDKFSKKVLEAEGVSPRDFIVKQIPDISSEGSSRRVWAKAEDLVVPELEDDELNPGMKKVLLEFFLSKGSYATEFIRQNFG